MRAKKASGSRVGVKPAMTKNRDPNQTPLHLACAPEQVAESLREAERLCARRGGQWTALREKVLRLLLESGRPTKAYVVLKQLRDNGAAKPPTVYRSLEFLIEMGLAHRIASLNAFIACGHPSHGHSPVFLICQNCGAAGELHARDSVNRLEHDIESVSFKMREAVIEVSGLCRACA